MAPCLHNHVLWAAVADGRGEAVARRVSSRLIGAPACGIRAFRLRLVGTPEVSLVVLTNCVTFSLPAEMACALGLGR